MHSLHYCNFPWLKERNKTMFLPVVVDVLVYITTTRL